MKLEGLRNHLRRRAKAKGKCESCANRFRAGVKTIYLEGHKVNLCVLCRQRDLELFRKRIGPCQPNKGVKMADCDGCLLHRTVRRCNDGASRCAVCINQLVFELKDYYQL